MASFIDELNGAPAEPATPATASPETAEQDGAVAAAAEGTDEGVDEPVDDAASSGEAETEIDAELLSDVAKDAGLDLNDPAQRAIAEKFARREMSKLASAAPQEGVDELTEFEKSLIAGEAKPAEAQKPPEQQPQQRQQTQPDNRYFDVGDTWKSTTDGYKAEGDAWGEVQTALDAGKDPAQAMQKVHDIRVAQQVRIFDAVFMPFLNQLIPKLVQDHGSKLIDSRLGGVMPHLEDTVNQNRFSTAKEAALTDLEKTKGFETVRALYEVDKTTPNLTFKDPVSGQIGTYPNTLLNRTIKAFPEILAIRVDHKDPAVAERLTMTARLKAVARYSRAGQVSPKTAKTIMNAGAQQQARRTTERTRQGLNAGGGAPSNNGVPADSLVGSINTHSNGSLTMAQVLAGAGRK